MFRNLFLVFFICSQFFAYSAEDFSSDNIVSVNPATIEQDGKQENQSELVYSLCTLILILNGRIARVIAAVAIFVVGIMFFMGKITWPLLVTVAIGLGMVFGAKAVAILLLPRAVQVYDSRDSTLQVKTTSQLISQACPELL